METALGPSGRARRPNVARGRFDLGVPRLGLLLRLLAFAVAYMVAYEASQAFRVPDVALETFWPPAGLSLAVMLRTSPRQRPLFALVMPLVEMAVEIERPLPVTMFYGTAGAIGALLGAAMLDTVQRPFELKTVRDVLALVGLGAGVASAVSGVLGAVGSVIFYGTDSGARVWLVWTLGDALAVVLFTPLLLFLLSRERVDGARVVEGLVAAVTLALAVHIAFGEPNLPAPALALAYATLPLMLWVALRIGMIGVCITSAVGGNVAAWHVLQGHGPFVGLAKDHHVQILAAESLVAVVAVSGLLLAASLQELRRSESEQRTLAKAGMQVAAWSAEPRALGRFASTIAPALVDGCVVLIRNELGRLAAASSAHVDARRVDALRASAERAHELAAGPAPIMLREIDEPAVERLAGPVERDRALLRELGPTSWISASIEADGRELGRIVLVSFSRHFDAGDLAVAQDLARRCSLALQTRRAIQLRDDFLNVASHELRTPLTPLLLRFSMLEASTRAGQVPSQQVIAAQKRDLQRLLALIDHMLDASKVAADRLELRVARSSLTDVVHSVVDRFRRMAPERAITLDNHPEPIDVEMDRDRIDQVLSNLLINAIKYSPPDTPISIALTLSHDHAQVEVSDRGLGIPPADVGRVFDRFFRAANAPVTSYGGLGIGLYLCRDIVERHGGKMHVVSALGEGSRFSFTLPLGDS
ncbi:MAG: hypothetical protein HOW73_05890 [Polyangiaceae bacterium]|nr:hypothetical protein [Polyangiaceae bacterium]